MSAVSKLVLEFLKVMCLAYDVESKAKIRHFTKGGWGDERGDAQHLHREQ